MVSEEEFGHLISEFESLRDWVMEHHGKTRTEIESIKEELKELKDELENSSKIRINKKIG